MKNNFFLRLVVMYMMKKLKYEIQRRIMNIQKFRKLISFIELITNLKKLLHFPYKRNALSLKEPSPLLDGIASVVQKCSVYLDKSCQHL